MSEGWAALQLHPSEEGTNSTLIEDSLTSILPGLEVFIPSVTVRDKRGEYTYSLFDGYVFVRSTDGQDYAELVSSPYISNLLTTTPTSKGVALIPDDEVGAMMDQLRNMKPSGFEVGSMISIAGGLFSGLKGKVMDVYDDKLLVEVYMPLGSLTKLTKIPKMFIKALED